MIDNLEKILVIINAWLWGKWLVFVLLGLGILYTVTNGFIQVRYFKFIIKKTLIDSFKARNEDKGEGSISSFKAMMVTLAGNVGGGNVVGIATAIAAGGTGGYVMTRALQFGITRGMYSNEAGEGTAPFAHGSAIVEHPCEEGIAGVTEVFVDTIIICTITALVVGVTGMYQSGHSATVMAIEAFGTVWFPLKHVATFALLIFCFTTLMGQWFNAAKSFTYAFGPKVTDKVKYVFPFLCIVGAITKIDLVWTIQDLAMGLVIIPNLIALIVLFPEVRKQTKDYFSNSKFYPGKDK